MSVEWMAYTVAISCLLGGAALAVERACRLRRWSSRWIWALALIAPFLLPLAALIDDEPSRRAATAAVPHSVQLASAAVVPSTVPLVAARADRITHNLHRLVISPGVTSLLAMLWLGGSTLLALGLLDSWLRMRQRSASWIRRAVDDTEVLVSEDIGPAVIGFLRPRIVVPAWLPDADPQVRRLVLAHENEHVRVRDPLLLLLGTLAVVALPWNLPLWWQWRRLRFAIEVDCDARVLASAGVAELAYAEALLNVAERSSEVPLAAAAMCESPSSLERRIALFLLDRSAHQGLFALLLLVVGIGVAAAATQIETPAAFDAQSSRRLVTSALGRELVEAINDGVHDSAVALIDAGADVNRVVLGDGSPLIAAVRQGDLSLAKLLLERGAQVDLQAIGDGSPLIAAATLGNLDIVTTLVEHGADVNRFVVGDETPLINAARAGHLDVVRYLVANGADVNLAVAADAGPMMEIRSPLGEALEHGQTAVADYLRSQGAAR
jgi:beta-lactamase regulating signal transducer with metallopeptidase domain